MKPLSATIEFTEELARVMSYGASLGEAVDIVSGDVTDKNLRRLFMKISYKKLDTDKFIQLLRSKPKYFPDEFVRFYQRALESQNRPEAFKNLIALMKNKREIRIKTDILFYAFVQFCILFLISFFFLRYVFGIITLLYEDMDVDLPLITQIMMTISKISTNPTVLAVTLTLMAGIIALFIAKGETIIETVLRVPVINSKIMNQYSFYFYSLMSELLKIGYTPYEALMELKNQKEMLPVAKYLDKILNKENQAQPASKKKRKLTLYSDSATSLLMEETDSNSLALFFSDEAENLGGINRLLTEKIMVYFQPVVMITVFLLFIIIAMAAFLPLYQTTQTL